MTTATLEHKIATSTYAASRWMSKTRPRLTPPSPGSSPSRSVYDINVVSHAAGQPTRVVGCCASRDRGYSCGSPRQYGELLPAVASL
jgi:hypothetical protein